MKASPPLRTARAPDRIVRAFFGHLRVYALVIALVAGLNMVTSRQYIWLVWPMLGWGVAVLAHGVSVLVARRRLHARAHP